MVEDAFYFLKNGGENGTKAVLMIDGLQAYRLD